MLIFKLVALSWPIKLSWKFCDFDEVVYLIIFYGKEFSTQTRLSNIILHNLEGGCLFDLGLKSSMVWLQAQTNFFDFFQRSRVVFKFGYGYWICQSSLNWGFSNYFADISSMTIICPDNVGVWTDSIRYTLAIPASIFNFYSRK